MRADIITVGYVRDRKLVISRPGFCLAVSIYFLCQPAFVCRFTIYLAPNYLFFLFWFLKILSKRSHFTSFSFAALTSHCRTACLCWACGTRTSGPGGILPLWSRCLCPSPDPGTRTARCSSPWRSTNAPSRSRRKKMETRWDQGPWIYCSESNSFPFLWFHFLFLGDCHGYF